MILNLKDHWIVYNDPVKFEQMQGEHFGKVISINKDSSSVYCPMVKCKECPLNSKNGTYYTCVEMFKFHLSKIKNYNKGLT